MGAEDKNPAPPTRDEETMDGYARSKIICTIGPASRRPDILREMAAGGMDVARINMSHGSLDEHRNTIRAIRSLGSVAVLLDLPGPKIRLGELKEPVMLREGDAVRFTTENVVGEGLTLPVNYDRLPAEVRPGGRVFINDGLIELTGALTGFASALRDPFAARERHGLAGELATKTKIRVRAPSRSQDRFWRLTTAPMTGFPLPHSAVMAVGIPATPSLTLNPCLSRVAAMSLLLFSSRSPYSAKPQTSSLTSASSSR